MSTSFSRDDVREIRDRALAEDRPNDWFDPLYVAADGDRDCVPWSLDGAHPALKSWISERPVSQLFDLDRARAIVIGCGLGDDAEAIAKLGFDVTAFDVSPRAVAWCRDRFADSRVDYCVVDLLALDDAWRGRFDFAFECRTVQALPLSVRDRAIDAVASLVSEGGRLVVVTHTRPTEDAPDGPPWPLSPNELDRFSQSGLTKTWSRDFEKDGRSRCCTEFARSTVG
ncbi:MAG: class I SAM-dependent methyltransferase [Geitlerinemataceae cyanobacterium]